VRDIFRRWRMLVADLLKTGAQRKRELDGRVDAERYRLRQVYGAEIFAETDWLEQDWRMEKVRERVSRPTPARFPMVYRRSA